MTTLFANTRQEKSREMKNKEHLVKLSFMRKEAGRTIITQNKIGCLSVFFIMQDKVLLKLRTSACMLMLSFLSVIISLISAALLILSFHL